MDFSRLQVFHAVARRLSFSQAAEDLYTSQPNVSKHVHELERELGVRLFHRLGRRVALTDAGRIVYDYAERAFDLTKGLQRALAELEGLERGSLRLGASSTPGLYLLPQALAVFHRRYAALDFSLQITNSQQVIQGVLQQTLDLGFVGGYVEATGLQVRPYVMDELVLIVPSRSPLLGAEKVPLERLAEETFIMRETGSGTRQVIEKVLAQYSLQPHRTMEMNGCEAVKRAVAAGLGLSFVSRYAVQWELAQGVVVILDIPGLRITRPLAMVSHKDIRPSAAALAFIAHLGKTSVSSPPDMAVS